MYDKEPVFTEKKDEMDCVNLIRKFWIIFTVHETIRKGLRVLVSVYKTEDKGIP